MLIVGPMTGRCAYAKQRLCSDGSTGARELTGTVQRSDHILDHPHNSSSS